MFDVKLRLVVHNAGTNWVAAGWLAFAIFFYGVIYTMWLKRATAHNIVIGGAAGAFPPIIGWAAATGSTPPEAWVLFAIIFFWTPPHFWALALFRNEDYQRAHIPMLPVTRGARTTTQHMLAYALILALTCALPFVLGYNGWLYGSLSFVLNGVFVWLTYSVYRAPENHAHAKKLFAYSIFYLFAIFSALLLDHALL